jgi:RNA polymerase sigma-70 factor (ECF subfamily)
MTSSAATAVFERERRRLTGLAYRMLGSVAEAEDVVQDAWLRWDRADQDAVSDAGAFLRKTVARLCLDRMKSARAKRESYIGPWLPEPVLEPSAVTGSDTGEWADDLSFALMLALERLSPLERAAFLLHDVFGVDFAEVAVTLDRAEPACRQLAARARSHVRSARPRFPVPDDRRQALASAFIDALRTGDISRFSSLLAEDAVLYTDAGGHHPAALNPIRGRDRIVRFYMGLARKGRLPGPGASWHASAVNGLPGFILVGEDGSVQTIAVEFNGEQVSAVYAVANPEKLRHLTVH